MSHILRIILVVCALICCCDAAIHVTVTKKSSIYLCELVITPTEDHSEMPNKSGPAEETYLSEYDDYNEYEEYNMNDGLEMTTILGNRYMNVTIEETFQIEQETLPHRNLSEESYLYTESNERNNIFACILFYIPDSYIVYINSCLSVQIVFVNVLVVCIFLKKKNRSPVTIILSSLAISDTISAISCTVQQVIGTFFNMQTINHRWVPNYPLCTIIFLLETACFCFHFASVYLTAVLAAQKALAVLFPLWSKSHISNTVCVVISVFIFGLQFCVFIGQCVTYDNMLEISNGTCYLTAYALDWVFYMSGVFYLVSVTIVAVSTSILCCKLICLRRNMLWNESIAAKQRNRRSAVTVVLISVIFVLSEGLMIYQFLLLFLLRIGYRSQSLYDEVDNYYSSSIHFTGLSWIIGFYLNFIVYLVMGKQLRNTLSRGCATMCIFVRCRN